MGTRARALLDPFYAPLVRAGMDEAGLLDAGFFDDGLHVRACDLPEADPRWICTPLPRNPTDGSAREAVLLSTGSFSPVHEGHLTMMEAARVAVEAGGRRVVGGYLSPSHDGYVSVKRGGSCAFPAAHRIQLIERAISESAWLMVDPWEAMHVSVPVNFTDVISRLERYLAHHAPDRRIDVVYVFGSDNIGFSHAFRGMGHGACVIRPGCARNPSATVPSPAPFAAPDVEVAGRVLTVPAPLAADVSSSAVRTGAMPVLSSVAFEWSAWRGAVASGDACVAMPEERRIMMRDDLIEATAHWRTDERAPALDRGLRALAADVESIVSRAFGSPLAPDVARRCAIERRRPFDGAHVSHPLRTGARILSLDVHVRGDADLAVSRLFEVADGQWRPSSYVARPGHPPLPEQLARVESGEWTLLDDDVASGGTMRAVRALLPPRIAVTGEMAVATTGPDPSRYLDVLDLRDFLVGCLDGGLVVRLPDGAFARAPYAAPYVCLRSRATIPPSMEMRVSMEVWEANLEFFRTLPFRLDVGDAAPGLRALARAAGFDDAASLEDLCRWHVGMLRRGACAPGGDAAP